MNEAVTEFLTRRMGRFPPDGTLLHAKAYEGSQRLISDYVAANPAREDALAKAYLTGDFGDLDRLEDASMRGSVFAMLHGPSAQRFRDWDARLANVLPGSSLTIDDETLSPPPLPVSPPVEAGRAYLTFKKSSSRIFASSTHKPSASRAPSRRDRRCARTTRRRPQR